MGGDPMGPPPSSQIPENSVTGPAGNIVPDAYQPHSLAGLPLVGTSGSALEGGIGVEAAQFEARIGQFIADLHEGLFPLGKAHRLYLVFVRQPRNDSGQFGAPLPLTVFLCNKEVRIGALAAPDRHAAAVAIQHIGRSFEPAAEDVPDPTLEREHVRSALAVRYLPVRSGLIRHDFDYTVFLENSIVHKGFLLLFVFIF